METLYCDRSITYWTPQHKYQAIEWLVKNKGYMAKDLNKRSSKEVYAIYHKIRGN